MSGGTQEPPRRANVTWQTGTLRAEGKNSGGATVCSDQRVTAGAAHHIVLTPEPALTRPDGAQYAIRANGSDAAFVLATIVDQNGNWCPLANNNITFSVSGNGVYRGSYNFRTTAGQGESYHAPGSPELAAEGGMMKVAVRSTFTPGQVTVTAASSGIGSGSAVFTTVAVNNPAVAASSPLRPTGAPALSRVYGKSVYHVPTLFGKQVYTITGRKVTLSKGGKATSHTRELAGTVLIIGK